MLYLTRHVCLWRSQRSTGAPGISNTRRHHLADAVYFFCTPTLMGYLAWVHLLSAAEPAPTPRHENPLPFPSLPQSPQPVLVHRCCDPQRRVRGGRLSASGKKIVFLVLPWVKS